MRRFVGVVVVVLAIAGCGGDVQMPSGCLDTAIRAAMEVIADCLPRDTSDPAAVRAALEECPVERTPPYEPAP
jgi:hypothetical protein